MVQRALILTLIWAALCEWVMLRLPKDRTRHNSPVIKSHVLEVGRTLAEFRMRKLGVTGDWRQYTTARLGIV